MKSILKFFTNTLFDANTIKADSNRRAKSKVYGVFSIVCSLLMVALSVVLSFGIVWLGETDIFTKIVLGIIVGVFIGGLGTLTMLIQAFIKWLTQLSINKNAITWISL